MLRSSQPLLYVLFALLLGSCGTKKNNEQEKDQVKASGTEWTLQMEDSGMEDYRAHWFLDGELAQIEHTDKGMAFSAGPTNLDDAHHAVLWTRESFAGDVKIRYDYTRLDSQIINVNILYIQATGTGEEGFDKDISQWNEARKVPAMSTYWKNMNLLHVSYAAFPMVNEDPTNDYIRIRRYPAPTVEEFRKTEIPPSYERTGLFLPGVSYQLTWVKTDKELSLSVVGDGREEYFSWDLSSAAPVREGRIGLRHMFTRSAAYRNIEIYTKMNTND